MRNSQGIFSTARLERVGMIHVPQWDFTLQCRLIGAVRVGADNLFQAVLFKKAQTAQSQHF